MHKYLYELCHLQDQQTAECQRKIGFLHCLGYDAMYFSKKVPKLKRNLLPSSLTLKMKAAGYYKMLVPMY